MRQGADGDSAPVPAAGLVEIVGNEVDFLEDQRDGRGEIGAAACRSEAEAGLFQQIDSHYLLQLAHRPVHRGLRDAEKLRARLEAAGPGRRLEGVEL